jgi:hypothetical protein
LAPVIAGVRIRGTEHMITCWDKEYKLTKQIKRGKISLRAPLEELAEWISLTRDVSVLNIIYDRGTSNRKPRLQIILEHSFEARKFRSGVNYNPSEQKAITNRFLEIIRREQLARFDLNGLFVIFSAFAPLAKEEADSRISDSDIEVLKKRIGNPDLWEISRCFGHVTFFFYTDAQLKMYSAQGKKNEYASTYFELLKPHDEFDYLKREDFEISFDSKQNFDDNYEGSWFYYHR